MCIPVNLYKESYDVYIGRAKRDEPYNIWCNPNQLVNTKDDAEREANLARYKTHLWNEIKAGRITKEMLIALDGKRLGCFCKPKLCHGDIIAKAVKWALHEKGLICKYHDVDKRKYPHYCSQCADDNLRDNQL